MTFPKLTLIETLEATYKANLKELGPGEEIFHGESMDYFSGSMYTKNIIYLCYFILGKGDDPELATQVLQFIFVSDNGFRFPIAQYPSGVCTPSSLYFCFWEGVLKMLEIGFE